ncbi:MAG: GNAT family N-acetyltransferase [Alphaproteobacteria bacterium]|nr:GNAT family N-acetyltransferase [Alphaproteobacteria bacterium]
MSASKLIRPSIDYKDNYLEALEEYHAEDRYLYQNIADLSSDFESFVKELSAEKGYPHQPYQDWVEPVPETVVWMIKDEQYLGTVDIRHRLNWHLEKWGGHVHFVIRPSMRGKGFGTKMLRKAMPIINYLGIDEALLTVAPDNEWAIEIIETCGGKFEDETTATDKFPAMRRYWLNCS